MNLRKLCSAGLAILALAACQKAADPYMTLETKTLTLEPEGGTATVTISANVHYTVNNDCYDADGNYWAKISDTVTNGEETTLTFTVDENTSTEARSNTVRFIGDKVTPLKLTITQNGVVPKGVSPESVTVGYEITSATMNVFGDRNWTASCADSDVTISPASGFGDSEVTVSFPENAGFSTRTITVNVAMEGDKTYTFTVLQAGFVGILADWDLNAMTDQTNATFVDEADQTEFPGTNGKYLDASTGNGRIEYYAVDRTGYSFVSGKKKVVCLRGVGGNGDPYVGGCIPGDYWLVTMGREGATIPAGTKIHYYFVTKMGLYTSTYWMLEYKVGDEWLPAAPVSEVTESATKTVSGAECDYSATVQYNFAATRVDGSKNGAYTAVEGTFATEADLDQLVFRFRMAGHMTLEGSKGAGLYIDQTHSSGQSRFSAQRPNDESGAQVKTYDQHVTFEIVE